MEQMAEDYVSFENAKLLKEKGFDELCNWLYSEETLTRDMSYRTNSNLDFWTDLKDRYSAPTQALVVKWLRVKYNIFIQLDWVAFNNNSYKVSCIDITTRGEFIIRNKEEQLYFNSPEEATEAAIKYIFEHLIK